MYVILGSMENVVVMFTSCYVVRMHFCLMLLLVHVTFENNSYYNNGYVYFAIFPSHLRSLCSTVDKQRVLKYGTILHTEWANHFPFDQIFLFFKSWSLMKEWSKAQGHTRSIILHWRLKREGKMFFPPKTLLLFRLFTSVGTTRGQGIIRVVVATFFWHSHFIKGFKLNKAQIMYFWA